MIRGTRSPLAGILMVIDGAGRVGRIPGTGPVEEPFVISDGGLGYHRFRPLQLAAPDTWYPWSLRTCTGSLPERNASCNNGRDSHR